MSELKVLIVNQEEVRRIYPMEECIEVMEQAFLSLARGKVTQPLRSIMGVRGGNVLAMMPSYNEDIMALGAKVITVFPGNHGTEFDAHQGIVLLYEAVHGSLKAIIDATAVTGIRTAAVSAVATRILANPGTKSLAILGAGTQGKAHLEAMRLLFDFESVHVWDVFPDSAKRFAESESKRTGLDVRYAASAEEAVSGHDLICTTTPAKEPILRGSWIKRGAHINAIGACTPVTRELDTEAVRGSSLFVDRMESALREAGDFIIPKNEGAFDDAHIKGELGDVLTGAVRGRQSEDEITLFKAVGLAMQDLASANYVFEKARKTGTGVEVEIGGRHFAMTD
jgi:ornithine cyclodeaminase